MSEITILHKLVSNKRSKLKESTLWSLLALIGKTIDDKKQSLPRAYLITLENIMLDSNGQVNVDRNILSKYPQNYWAPELVNINSDWSRFDVDAIIKVLMYSLGMSIKMCLDIRKRGNANVSDDLSELLTEMSHRNPISRPTLSRLLQTCNQKGRRYTEDLSFNQHILDFYKSYNDRFTKKDRLSKTNSVEGSDVELTATRGNRQHSLLLEDCRSNHTDSAHQRLSYFDSSTESLECSESAMSTTSDSTNNSVAMTALNRAPRSNYLLVNSIDLSASIVATQNRAKARKKLSGVIGPVRTKISGTSNIQDFGGVQLGDSRIGRLNQVMFESNNQISTTAHIAADRNILGPEFAIRKSENKSISAVKPIRRTRLSRAESSRVLSLNVSVQLLSGLTLNIRGLLKHSTVSTVIETVGQAHPDLEFVNYGLCVMIDDEYFFLRVENIVADIAQYLNRKKPKADGEKCLHLFYRLQFYPTPESLHAMDAISQRQLYLQLRQDIVHRNCPPLTFSDSITLAGLAMRAEYGDPGDEAQDDKGQMTVENYFHSSFHRYLDAYENETEFLLQHQNCWKSFSWQECQRRFIERVQEQRFYGMHWYRVNKNQLEVMGALGKETCLLIGCDGIQLVDKSSNSTTGNCGLESSVHRHFCYKWRQIEVISLKQKKLIVIKPRLQLKVHGVNEASSFYQCHIDSHTKAKYIIRLCRKHHLLASQFEDSTIVNGADNPSQYQQQKYESNKMISRRGLPSHLRSVSIDYPRSLKNSVDYPNGVFVDFSSDDDSRDNSSDEPEETYDGSRSAREAKESTERRSRCGLFATQQNGKPENLNPKRGTSCGVVERSNFQTKQMKNNVQKLDPTFKEIFDSDNQLKLKPSLKDFGRKYQLDKRPSTERSGEMFEVELHQLGNEGSLGIGIVALSEPVTGIFVKCLRKHSQADRLGTVRVHDEIVAVNGESVSHRTKDEVAQLMLQSGAVVRLQLRRDNYSTDNQKSPLKVNEERCFSSTPKKELKTLKNILESKRPLEHLDEETMMDLVPSLQLSSARISNNMKSLNLDLHSKTEYRLLQNVLGRYGQVIPGSKLPPMVRLDLAAVSTVLLNHKLPLNFLVYASPGLKRASSDEYWRHILIQRCPLVVQLNFGYSTTITKRQENGHQLNGLRRPLEILMEKSVDLNKCLNLQCVRISESPTSETSHRVLLLRCTTSFSSLNKDSLAVLLNVLNIASAISRNVSNGHTICLSPSIIDARVGMAMVLFGTVHLFNRDDNPQPSSGPAPIMNSHTIVYHLFHKVISQRRDWLPSEAQFGECMYSLAALCDGKVLGNLNSSSSNQQQDQSDVE